MHPLGERKATQATRQVLIIKEDVTIKSPLSLPFASCRFFVVRETPAPHSLAAHITKTFSDLVASTLTEPNCLLPKGFIDKVIDRGAVALTGTNRYTPPDSYAQYFYTITHHLNQSYATRFSPWLPFYLAPTAIYLAVDSVPTEILPDDNDELFPFLKESIRNAQAVAISAARDLNNDRPAQISKEAYSIIVSVDPQDVQKRFPPFFLYSAPFKVIKTVNTNRYTPYSNCYYFGPTSQLCKQKHPLCPRCELHHTRATNRFQNRTCPKHEHSRLVSRCCPTSGPHCPSSGSSHDAFSRECRVRAIPPPRLDALPAKKTVSTPTPTVEKSLKW